MPHIAEESIRKVAEATDIVELIGSYFPLKRAGSTYRALCPFHREKTPSFHVNPSRQSYHCFGCGAGGNVFRFLMEYEHLQFVEAVRRLAQRAGLPLIEEAGGGDEGRADRRRRLLALHAAATAWFHERLMKSSEGAAAREYLKSRAIDTAIARGWQLGYAPDSWDALLEAMRAQGFSREELATSGLATSREDAPRDSAQTYARFRNRLMFPICNDYGEVIAFSGRVLDAEAKAAKYVNSPETPIFTKGRVLYGLHKSKRALIEHKEAVVCEGQLDLIRAFESGVQNVIAPQGTAFTDEQARLLSRFVETALLCFDSDAAGQEAAAKSLPSLLECGLQVRVVRLPAGHDPDSLIRSEGAPAFRHALEGAKDFFDYALDRATESGALEDPARTAAASRKLATYLASVKDPVARETIAGRIAARLRIAPSSLAAQIRQVKPVKAAAIGETPALPSLQLAESMRVLCVHALVDPESRAWLATHGAAQASSFEAGGALLERIVAWSGDAGRPSEVAAFVSSLPPEMERAWAALDLEAACATPAQRIEITRQWWTECLASPLRAKLQAAGARLRQPGLSREQMFDIQKEILDLKERLNELLRPAA